jgi:hypothetical protein
LRAEGVTGRYGETGYGQKKGMLSKVRLQVVRQGMGVDKSVMEGGKRATIRMKQAMCLSQTHISDAGSVIKSWSETTAMGMGLLPKCTEMNPNKRK